MMGGLVPQSRRTHGARLTRSLAVTQPFYLYLGRRRRRLIARELLGALAHAYLAIQPADRRRRRFVRCKIRQLAFVHSSVTKSGGENRVSFGGQVSVGNANAYSSV